LSESSTRAAELRRAFDESFARAPDVARETTEDFLLARVGGDPFALRVSDFARIVAAPRVIAVPSRRATVLGVAAIRGVVVSVHSLAVLLGYEASASAPKWIALTRVDTIGLAFGELDRVVRAPATRERALTQEGITRPVVDVTALVERIQNGATDSKRRND
jgi:chemotaxis signal transduction protein